MLIIKLSLNSKYENKDIYNNNTGNITGDIYNAEFRNCLHKNVLLVF